MHRGSGWEIQKERDHQENLDAGGRVTIQWMLEKENRVDRDQWQALVNTVMNLRIT
jgi:hypothetical protein